MFFLGCSLCLIFLSSKFASSYTGHCTYVWWNSEELASCSLLYPGCSLGLSNKSGRVRVGVEVKRIEDPLT